MKHFPCPVCGGESKRLLYRGSLANQPPVLGYGFSPEHFKTFDIVRCEPCSHAFCSPRPENLEKNYRFVRDEAYLSQKPQRLRTSQEVLRQLRSWKPRGSLLDIGCATGDFLSAASVYYESEGLEPSEWAAALAEGAGFKIYRQTLSQFQESRRYDVATMWGVIEHLEEPLSDMKRVHELLRPGGVAAIWTGDAESLPAKMLGKKWWNVQGQHLHLFSRKSLVMLMRRAGFAQAAITTYPYLATLGNMAHSLKRYRNLDGFTSWVLRSSKLQAVPVRLRIPGEMLAIFRKAD